MQDEKFVETCTLILMGRAVRSCIHLIDHNEQVDFDAITEDIRNRADSVYSELLGTDDIAAFGIDDAKKQAVRNNIAEEHFKTTIVDATELYKTILEIPTFIAKMDYMVQNTSGQLKWMSNAISCGQVNFNTYDKVAEAAEGFIMKVSSYTNEISGMLDAIATKIRDKKIADILRYLYPGEGTLTLYDMITDFLKTCNNRRYQLDDLKTDAITTVFMTL